MTTVPVARGLVLCLSSHEDFASGRLTLTDCFTDLAVPALPSPPRTFWVAAYLADGYGRLDVVLQIIQPDTGGTVYDGRHGITIRDRLEAYPYRYQVGGCVFPAAGTYEVVLVVAGELVAVTPFTIRQEEPDDE